MVFSDITPELRLKTQFNQLIQVQKATLDKLTDAVAVFGSDGRLSCTTRRSRLLGLDAGAARPPRPSSTRSCSSACAACTTCSSGAT